MKNNKPIFITIKPDGFHMNGILKKTLDIFVRRESRARKFWRITDKKRYLACFSSNGKISKNGTIPANLRKSEKTWKLTGTQKPKKPGKIQYLS